MPRRAAGRAKHPIRPRATRPPRNSSRWCWPSCAHVLRLRRAPFFPVAPHAASRHVPRRAPRIANPALAQSPSPHLARTHPHARTYPHRPRRARRRTSTEGPRPQTPTTEARRPRAPATAEASPAARPRPTTTPTRAAHCPPTAPAPLPRMTHTTPTTPTGRPGARPRPTRPRPPTPASPRLPRTTSRPQVPAPCAPSAATQLLAHLAARRGSRVGLLACSSLPAGGGRVPRQHRGAEQAALGVRVEEFHGLADAAVYVPGQVRGGSGEGRESSGS